MHITCRSVLAICLLLLAASCRSLDQKGATAEDAAAPDSPEVAEPTAEDVLRGEEYPSANADPALAGLPPGYTLAELKETIRKLEASRAQKNKYRLDRYDSEQRAINEVVEGMLLPHSYGRTVRISPDHEPIVLPPGPMEELVQKKVSMQLKDAGVEELMLALSKIDGLNIIADQALNADRQLTISVEDVPLQDLLSYISRNMGIEFHVGRDVIWVTQSTSPAGGGPELITRIFRLRKGFIPTQVSGSNPPAGGATGFGNAPAGFGGANAAEDMDLYDALIELGLDQGPEGSVLRLFKNRNLLLIRNTATNLRLAEEVIASFDVAPKQVLIEARFLTISQDDLNQLGIDIENVSMNRGDPENPTHDIESLVYSSIFDAFTEGANSPQLTMSGILGNNEYRDVLRALHKLTDADTLSAPRLTLMNNQSAQIRRGSDFYYFEEWEVIVSDTIITGEGDAEAERANNVLQPVGRPTKIQQGITLDVSVNIGNDGKTVLLSLAPSIRNVDKLNFFASGSFSSVNPNEETDSLTEDTVGYFLPEVSDSSVRTAVAVESGETVVLGGILENRITEELQKVPVLGDLPLVGALFRRTLVSREPRHLLIFVTARVVNPTGEYVEVTAP